MALNLSKHEPFSLDRIFYYQEQMLRKLVPHLYKNSPFYRKKLDEAGVARKREVPGRPGAPSLRDQGRAAGRLPLGLMAAPKAGGPDPLLLWHHRQAGNCTYTAYDVSTWAEMMALCMAMAGVTARDRIQVTPGYGLDAGMASRPAWSGSALAIPTGPGNTEKQLEMMVDLQTTVLTATPLLTPCSWPRK